MVDWVFVGKLVYDCVLAASCTIAVWLGGTHERIGAAIAMAASGVTVLILPFAVWTGIPGRYGFFLVNAATLLAFDAVMVRSRSFWPVWATGCQLATVSLDLCLFVFPVEAKPYLALQGKLAYPVLLALAAGSVRRWWRASRHSTPHGAADRI